MRLEWCGVYPYRFYNGEHYYHCSHISLCFPLYLIVCDYFPTWHTCHLTLFYTCSRTHYQHFYQLIHRTRHYHKENQYYFYFLELVELGSTILKHLLGLPYTPSGSDARSHTPDTCLRWSRSNEDTCSWNVSSTRNVDKNN